MGKEIERKFLLRGDEWRKLAEGKHYCQGYLSSVKERTVRVRTVGTEAFLTIKGASVGATRSEYEYPIPLHDAEEMLKNLCEQPLIEKMRYKVRQGKLTWEIDEFFGENGGLIVAEIELPDENAAFERPSWIGREVTHNPLYFNANLIKHPFTRWSKEEKEK